MISQSSLGFYIDISFGIDILLSMNDVLEKIFDSPVRARLFKLFLRNADKAFKIGTIAQKVQFHPRPVKAQVARLHSIGFLRRKKISRREKRGRPKGEKIQRLAPGIYYTVNQEFDFFKELQQLIFKSVPRPEEQLIERIRKIGGIKLALISGVFLGQENTRADLLLVGDNMNQVRLKKFLTNLEAEIGKEIDYTTMSSQDFVYRYDMFDRFLRDILEGPHKKLINKLRI